MANEKRLIDANALVEKAHWIIRSDGTRVFVIHAEDVDDAPTVDAVEVVHGRWEHIRDYGNGNVFGYCSNCKTPIRVNSQFAFELDNHYCRYCGAKMDGGNEDG